jgi:hypothetical protein
MVGVAGHAARPGTGRRTALVWLGRRLRARVAGDGGLRARDWLGTANFTRGWLGMADCAHAAALGTGARGRPAGEEPTARGVVWEESARGRPAGEVTAGLLGR